MFFFLQVVISHHLKEELKTKFPSNITQKPDVDKVENNTIFFIDGTRDDVDVILYCTGFNFILYTFKFIIRITHL